jgi:sulfite exporter TauE/SafE
MLEASVVAALLLGLSSGGHCAGMCGGIVAALSASSRRGGRAGITIGYHAGRAASYAVAGALAGALGQIGLSIRGTLEVQQMLFAFASLAMLVTGLYLAGVTPLVRRIEALGHVLWRRIEPWSRALLPVTTPARALLLGSLWGWLPCGMVYGALLLAVGTGRAFDGALTMTAFAAGTLPGLLGIGALAALTRARQQQLRIVLGGAVAAFGAFGLMQLGLHLAALDDYCLLPIAR